MAKDNDLPSVDTMAAELERGFWAAWAPALREAKYSGKAGAPISYINPGSAIEERFDILGITKDSGVGDFGYYTSDAEIRQVIDWAQRYTVKTFVGVN